MTSSQRATLAFLTVLVFVAAVVAGVAATTDGDSEPAAGGPLTTSIGPTSIAPTTTSATPVPAPATTATTLPATTTTTTADSTTTTSEDATTTTSPERRLVLRADGIGDLYFGDDAGRVLNALVEVLGEPDDDTDWVDQAEHFGICLGENVRFVRWGTLQAFFTDGPSEWRPAEVRHFASYTHSTVFEGRSLDLVTVDGLALGSPVGDIRARYGQDSVFDDELYGPVFVHDPPGAAYLWGTVSGLAPDDVIEGITGSRACGE